MAYSKKTMHNKVTGQDITFVQTAKDTNGRLLEMVSTYNPQSKESLAHYHPEQVKDIEILDGELTVRLDGRMQTLHKGDKLHIPIGHVHAMWNTGQQPAIVNRKLRPALNTEYLLETIFGLANDGKTNAQEAPSLLQSAVTAAHFADDVRFAKPPYLVQCILFALLTPVTLLLGYRATYPTYIN